MSSEALGVQQPASRYANVDVLRGVAALAVLVYHVIELGHWNAFPMQGPLVAFRLGWVGVDLFFVISGFVIALGVIRLHRAHPDEFARTFWSRRLARIVPLHLLTMAVWIAWVDPAFFGGRIVSSALQLGAHVAFVHNLRPETFSSINGINWTLAVEMQFYLAVALLVRWIDRTPGVLVFLACILVAWAWRGAMVLVHGHDDTWHLFMAVSQLPGQLDEFGAGILLAKLVLGDRTGRARAPLWWALGACVFGYAAFRLYWPHATYWDVPPMIVFWRSALALFLLCLVAAAVTLPQVAGRRWLRPFAYLGEISYGIYLWQLVAIAIAVAWAGAHPAWVLVVTLALTIAASALSWHTIERPIVQWARTPVLGVRTGHIAR